MDAPPSPPAHTAAKAAQAASPTLLQRVAAGEEQAVAACLETYGGLIWSVARRLSLGPADAEDAVQEIFIDLWRSAARFDPAVASEAAFVTMLARRRAIDRRRRAQRRPQAELISESLPEDTDGPDAVAALADEADAARRALEQLRPEPRRVIELAVWHGLTHTEIAERLDMPLGTVKTHARRGLQKVREALAAGNRSSGSEAEA